MVFSPGWAPKKAKHNFWGETFQSLKRTYLFVMGVLKVSLLQGSFGTSWYRDRWLICGPCFMWWFDGFHLKPSSERKHVEKQVWNWGYLSFTLVCNFFRDFMWKHLFVEGRSPLVSFDWWTCLEERGTKIVLAYWCGQWRGVGCPGCSFHFKKGPTPAGGTKGDDALQLAKIRPNDVTCWHK